MRSLVVYHGTNSRFAEFDQGKARIANDFYGGGVAYFTDSIAVAKTYASAMYRKNGGDKFVYECHVRLDKMFDVDEIYTGEELKSLIGNEIEFFARGARLLSLGTDRTKVLGDLKEGVMKLTGDQVFRGMSGGMVQTAMARKRLQRLGYDGLRYNGGVNMGMATRHNVYLAYEARSIKILKRYIVSPTPVTSTEKQQTYTFI